MEKSSDIRLEVFKSKVAQKGKTGIKIPLREKEAQERIEFLTQLLKNEMLSAKYYAESIEEINSRTLDEDMYKEFCELLRRD